jgi:hypothetical protein
MIDKSRACFDKREDLSTEHFIELIGRRIRDCEAWEKKLRSQGNLKEAEKIRKTKDQMMKSLGVLQKCQSPKKR